jgi:SAM-dependent methyltransferase
MRIRKQIESLIPETPREIVKGFLRRICYPAYGLNLDSRKLTAYSVKYAEPALWSADSKKPHGTMMSNFSFSHFLLARSMIRTCDIHSWCDLGTGCATLPFQAARLGVDSVFAIDGSEAALRGGKVLFPLNNYSVADICMPVEVTETDGTPARFDVVSALELVEHIPDAKLRGLFDNIRRLEPRFVIFAIGLQPDPPYHVNLKSMSVWLEEISSMLPGWIYDDILSVKIFEDTRRNSRYINEYPTNHLPLNRNLVIFTRRERSL